MSIFFAAGGMETWIWLPLDSREFGFGERAGDERLSDSSKIDETERLDIEQWQ